MVNIWGGQVGNFVAWRKMTACQSSLAPLLCSIQPAFSAKARSIFCQYSVREREKAKQKGLRLRNEQTRSRDKGKNQVLPLFSSFLLFLCFKFPPLLPFFFVSPHSVCFFCYSWLFFPRNCWFRVKMSWKSKADHHSSRSVISQKWTLFLCLGCFCSGMLFTNRFETPIITSNSCFWVILFVVCLRLSETGFIFVAWFRA